MPVAGQLAPTPAAEMAGVIDRARRAAFTALDEWRQTDAGIGQRFKPAAFGLYGLTKRSPKYRKRHPSPYYHQGRFYRQTLAGSGRIVQLDRGAAGWQIASTTPAARGLSFSRNKGIYLREWATLHPREAAAIDGAVQQRLDRLA